MCILFYYFSSNCLQSVIILFARFRQAITPVPAAANSSSIHGSPMGYSSPRPVSPPVSNDLRGPDVISKSGSPSPGVGTVPVFIMMDVDCIGSRTNVTSGAYAAFTCAVCVLLTDGIAEVDCIGRMLAAATGSRHASNMPATKLNVICLMVFMLFYSYYQLSFIICQKLFYACSACVIHLVVMHDVQQAVNQHFSDI